VRARNEASLSGTIGDVSVTELRCTSCNAPVDLSAGAVQSCRYCGASLVIDEAPRAHKKLRERAIVRHVVVLTRCGPSNYERVEKLLRGRGVKAEDAHAWVRAAPHDVEAWDNMLGIDELVRQIEEAGAQASVEERVTKELLPPDVRVVLEDASGAKLAAVMRAIRAVVDLDMTQTKSLIARAPVTIVEAIEEPKGRALHEALAAAGARATITEID
jgi:ribosomal protein L7/L12